MTRTRRTVTVLGLALAAVALSPAGARGDGLPVLGIDAGGSGAATAGSPDRLVTLDARRGTVVARVRRDGGRVQASRFIPGTFTIPAVALDGTGGGLSADGRTQVLVSPRAGFPRARTGFLVLGAKHLSVRRRISLRGDFSFDAISPDGRSMYLIHYLSRTDPTRYEVRGLDVRAARLRPGAIVDRREPDETMRGLPVTRATSDDGRWAYTLYDGGAHPFVHALDTARGNAYCIDLDALTGSSRVATMRLVLAGGGLDVRDGERTVARIDTARLRVLGPAPAGARDGSPGGGSDGPWPLLLAAAAALALASAVAVGRLRARATG